MVQVIRLASFLPLWFSVCLSCDGEGKRLMEASCWERLTEGEMGLVLIGRVMLCKPLIQSSFEGWVVYPPFYLARGQTVVEIMKIMPTCFKGPMHCYTLCPQACSRPLLTHAFTKIPGHSWASLGHSLVG